MQKTHKQLIIIIFIFAFPVIASWFLYHYHAHFNFKTTQHGVLLSAPIHTQYDKEKKWRVVYLNDHCDAGCQKITAQLQQVKKALGKDSQRIDVTLVNHISLQWKKIAKNITQQEKKSFTLNNKIYLIDPIGNLFMYYPGDIDLLNVLKDLKRVLEVSQIG